MKRWNTTISLVLLLGIVFLAGCIGGAKETSPPVITPVTTPQAGVQAPATTGPTVATPVIDEFRIGYQPFYSQAWDAVIIRQTGMLAKYLPGTLVTWNRGIQGAPLINAMAAGKLDLSYTGDHPGLAGTANEALKSRILASCSYDPHGITSALMVPNDSPLVSLSYAAAGLEGYRKGMKELEGKNNAVPQGSYTHRWIESTFDHNKVPVHFVHQTIEVQLANIRTGKLDSAATWEPLPTLWENLGVGKVFLRGLPDADWNSLCVISARPQFIEQHREVVVRMLMAETEAKRILMEDPEKAYALIANELAGTPGFDMRVIAKADQLTEYYDAVCDISPRERGSLTLGYKFLREKAIIKSTIRDKGGVKGAYDIENAVDTSMLKEACARLKGQGIDPTTFVDMRNPRRIIPYLKGDYKAVEAWPDERQLSISREEAQRIGKGY